MSCENRGALRPAAPAPVYTVYPGEERDGTDYAFHPAHPQAPPPKYEDVVNGMSAAEVLPPVLPRRLPTGGSESVDVFFVAPVPKHSVVYKTIAFIFGVLFLTVFVTILIKMLAFN